MALSLPGLSPMRNASAKRSVKNNPLQINIIPKTKTSSAILKILKIVIQNQVLGVNIKSKPTGEKTRGIASLHCIQIPNGMDDLIVGFHCFDNREMYLYHGRANALQ